MSERKATKTIPEPLELYAKKIRQPIFAGESAGWVSTVSGGLSTVSGEK